MNGNVSDLRSVRHSSEALASGKGNGVRAAEDAGCVVEKNFVGDAGCESGPVDHGAAFDEQAGDFEPAQAVGDRHPTGSPIAPPPPTLPPPTTPPIPPPPP